MTEARDPGKPDWMDFAQFVAPMAVETFMADCFGRRPVQIRRGIAARWLVVDGAAGGIAGGATALD